MVLLLVVFYLCWFAVDGSYVNNCSGGIHWTLWGHCRSEVDWRTMHQMDHGYRKESWRISTANDWASCEKRESIQSVFLPACPFFHMFGLFCWCLVFISYFNIFLTFCILFHLFTLYVNVWHLKNWAYILCTVAGSYYLNSAVTADVISGILWDKVNGCHRSAKCVWLKPV